MIPERYQAPCSFCPEPVDIRPGHGSYRETKGWEPVRTGGGGNTVALAERTGRYAHGVCLDLERIHAPAWEQLGLGL